MYDFFKLIFVLQYQNSSETWKYWKQLINKRTKNKKNKNKWMKN